MSNVKKVKIQGWFKDTMERSKERDDFQMLIGSLNMPHYGLDFEWTGDESKYTEKNQYGGHDFAFQYTIIGTEAISFDALRDMVKKLRSVGIVDRAIVRDIEEKTVWAKIA